MKYIKQLTLILLISFMGELLNALLPFPIPASIYGMVLLLAGLLTGLIKLDWVKEAGLYLVEIMPIFFIPVCVGLLDAWVNIAPFWFPLVTISCLTTVIVMVVTGKTAQGILRRGRKKDLHADQTSEKEAHHE